MPVKKENKYISRLSTALFVIGFLDVAGILLLALPAAREMLSSMAGIVTPVEFIAFGVGLAISASIYFLVAWGLRKRNKVAYYATWVLLLVLILKLRIIGLILDIFMVIWLIKCRKEFLK
jgi:lysylphosphatidylglycerol synthetase-like protein (DUF2156 family)